MKDIKGAIIDFANYPRDVEKIFPPLEKVVLDFCRRNKLNKQALTKTSRGLITRLYEGDLIFYTEDSSMPSIEPYIGGGGTHYVKSSEMIYICEGKLNNKKLELITKINHGVEYKRAQTEPTPRIHNFPRIHQDPWEESGKEENRITRKDNKDNYWFIIDISESPLVKRIGY